MAVFTTFSKAALQRYLVMFDIGELVHYAPITSGIENSNYFVTLSNVDATFEFVLTITENLSFDEVPFFNDLFHQLERARLPVPNPQRTLDGMSSTIFCGKPAWLFSKLPGEHPVHSNLVKCEAIGATLARIHAAAGSARYSRPNPYDLAWARQVLASKRYRLTAADAGLLVRALDEYESLGQLSALPSGIIHGDLFRDNSLFEGDALTGVIDFYHACIDYLVQDVAITINEWCTDESGVIDPERQTALLRGYESVRTLDDAEHQSLPSLQRYGATRFILTRLLSGSDGNHLKDPEEFLKILRNLSRRYHR